MAVLVGHSQRELIKSLSLRRWLRVLRRAGGGNRIRSWSGDRRWILQTTWQIHLWTGDLFEFTSGTGRYSRARRIERLARQECPSTRWPAADRALGADGSD